MRPGARSRGRELSRAVNSCHHRGMDKRLVIDSLREHKEELNAAGVVHLRVFGSVARDEEASPTSDVDLRRNSIRRSVIRW